MYVIWQNIIEDKKEEKKGKGETQHEGGEEEEDTPEYQAFRHKNWNSISKLIVDGFPKYFLFFAFSVGFWASRAPTDFAVALTYSHLIVRMVHVYAYYYYNPLMTAIAIGFAAFINFMLIFTGLIHKY